MSGARRARAEHHAIGRKQSRAVGVALRSNYPNPVPIIDREVDVESGVLVGALSGMAEIIIALLDMPGDSNHRRSRRRRRPPAWSPRARQDLQCLSCAISCQPPAPGSGVARYGKVMSKSAADTGAPSVNGTWPSGALPALQSPRSTLLPPMVRG